MPYTRDKARRAQCRQLLDLSIHDLTPLLDSAGQLHLDTPDPAQQLFQALLQLCLFSRKREHPFDRMCGRAFPDLLWYYGRVLPHPDRLVLRLTCAARVARYLLPTLTTPPNQPAELTGIPGLRLEEVTRRSLVLRHLPTGGLLEIRDQSQQLDWCDLQILDEYDPRRQLLKNALRTTPAEDAFAHYWAPTPCTALRSALITRGHLWWRAFQHEAATDVSHRPGGLYRIRWSKGYRTNDVGELLTASSIAIPGAIYRPAARSGDAGVLQLGDALVELDGPHTAEEDQWDEDD
ncbi:hypothetical protein ACIOUE_38985 [Streptomyces xanthochromogenes]|uniref:hypothetical protein n=1 Tax=Streptomyces xanthochromogenes TaxID=67384 RepID=UPI003802A4A3